LHIKDAIKRDRTSSFPGLATMREPSSTPEGPHPHPGDPEGQAARQPVDPLLAPTVAVRRRTPASAESATYSALDPQASLRIPQVPGYEILREVGRGGMGVVYEARQVALNRVVALKMLPASIITDPELLARFRGEAEAIARLQHPNIIQVYEVGACEDGPFFVMEFAEGGSLARIWGGAPQDVRTSAELVATLAEAVHAAHEKGVVHRDLKPSNILLAARRVPKVSDFGLARRLDDGGHRLTLTGQTMGTPGYMSPEQA